jgi:hypothetical protein
MQHLLRRKIKYLLFTTLLWPAFAFAQLRDGINLEDHDAKLFHFGINVGTNRAHYSITHHPYFLQQDSVMAVESVNSTGINLALLVNMNLSPHFDLRTFPLDLIFTEKAFEYRLKYPDIPAGEDSITTKKVQGVTLALPLQIKFSSDRIANFKAYMMLGAKLEYDLAGNKGQSNSENLLKIKKFDYGLETGIGFHLYFPVFVLTPELKIGYGLNNLHSRDPNLKFSNIMDKLNSRTITFSLTVE